MKYINGHKYNLKNFDDYRLRLIVEITDIDKENHRIDIYTTRGCVDEAFNDLLDIETKRVDSFIIAHHATKLQDDMASKMIDEWINESN